MKVIEVKELEFLMYNLIKQYGNGIFSGYDLTKLISPNFDKFSHQQIYRSLNRFTDVLWTVQLDPQDGKPDRKIYSVVKDIKVEPSLRVLSVNTLLLTGDVETIKAVIEQREKQIEVITREFEREREAPSDKPRYMIPNITAYRIEAHKTDICVLKQFLHDKECESYTYQLQQKQLEEAGKY